MKQPRLVIADGDVPGLLAVVALARSNPDGSVVWCPGALQSRSQAVANQCQVLGLDYVGVGSDGLDGQTANLLEAAGIALSSGCTSVIWPVNAQVQGADGGPEVPRVAAALRRASLVTTLVRLDLSPDSSFSIEAPYADLTDRQLADLVLDMDLPIWLCWWAVSSSAQALAQRAHWTSMLNAAGWTGPLPGSGPTQDDPPEVVIPSHRSAARPR